MAEMLQKVVGSNGKKEKKQEERAMVKTSMNKSFAEMVKGSDGRGGEVVRVEVKEEEIRGNLRKLEHCLVVAGALAQKMGRILLEFQYVGEADRVLSFGSRRVGGVQLGLERWSPRCGCEMKVGVGRKYGHGPHDGEDGGSGMGSHPSQEEEWRRHLEAVRKVNYREEVRGDDAARAIPRVGEEESARPEALLPYADENDGQVRGAVGDGTGKWARAGSGAWVPVDLDPVDGLLHSGPSAGRMPPPKAQRGDKIASSPLKGLKLKGVVIEEAGLGIGPSYSKPDGWIDVGESPDWSGSNGLAGNI
ncbi:hypothetical protein CK203_089986 [Vitis vinifera]|uniref:DUF4283 domain-containing protein n=1 Tax=Vitis vinifera TaxID=29760 RepID=A0A438BSJ3_VITVI|nr:hypothetical protein CK203_089986 [Vitis vinifera]